jgi:hypothetical protein
MSKKTTKNTETVETVETVKVADIARNQLEIDPKVARAKMRKIYNAEDADTKKLPKPIKEGSWTFAAKDEAAILDLLTQ